MERQNAMTRVRGGDWDERWGMMGGPPKNMANGPFVSSGILPLNI